MTNSGQTQFFFRHFLQHKKHKTSKNSLTKQKEGDIKKLKQHFFVLENFLRGGKTFIYVFFYLNSFVKKIWACPDSVIYNTTDLFPPQPLMENYFLPNLLQIFFIYMHLFLSLRIASYLWSPVKIIWYVKIRHYQTMHPPPLSPTHPKYFATYLTYPK